MAAPSVTYTFSNSTTADATQVNTNFTDLVNSLSDGLKDLTVSSLGTATITVSGAATFNGTVALGNATTDDVTITGYIASDILPKTTGTASLGSATQAWEDIYLDEGATNGGSVYFNAGTTSYIQSNAAGTVITVGGFTSMVPPAAINAAGALTIGTNGSTTALTLSTAQLATFAGSLNFSKSGETVFSADTSDGADNKRIVFCGGGANGASRGASLELAGNENGDAGAFYCVAGTNANISLVATGTGYVDVTGGQIKFPASQNASADANTLDDYEEGTWTPADVSGAGLSLTSVSGTYTKIGRLVRASFAVTYPATASTAQAAINLPITASSSTSNGGFTVFSTKATEYPYFVIGGSSANCFPYIAGGANYNNVNLSGQTIRAVMVYEA